ncbi:hypothetical protein C8R43DRAFT_152656 [Mycena crocata]|nr:hypothetical protein C8R43DRAFT_152656 [Mycena crocata]
MLYSCYSTTPACQSQSAGAHLTAQVHPPVASSLPPHTTTQLQTATPDRSTPPNDDRFRSGMQVRWGRGLGGWFSAEVTPSSSRAKRTARTYRDVGITAIQFPSSVFEASIRCRIQVCKNRSGDGVGRSYDVPQCGIESSRANSAIRSDASLARFRSSSPQRRLTGAVSTTFDVVRLVSPEPRLECPTPTRTACPLEYDRRHCGPRDADACLRCTSARCAPANTESGARVILCAAESTHDATDSNSGSPQ